MKKICILLIIVLTTLFGCQKNDTIQIGLVGTMTGLQSDLSISGRRGAELAVSILNEQGGLLGKNIELVVKDDQNRAEVASDLVKSFENEGIDVVVGPFTSAMMMAAYEPLLDSDLLYVSPTVSTDFLNDKDDNFIRLITSTKDQAIALSEMAIKNHHLNFIVIMDSNNKSFSELLLKNFEELLGKSEGKIKHVIEFESLTEEKMPDIITQVKSYGDDVQGLLFITSANDFGILSQNLNKNNITITGYAPLWARTSELIRIGGPYVENHYVVSALDLDNTSPSFVSIKEAFFERYGEPMTFASMYSYEAVMTIADAIRAGNSTDTMDVKANIIKIQNFEGVQGIYSINSYGDATRTYHIDQIKNGRFVNINEK